MSEQSAPSRRQIGTGGRHIAALDGVRGVAIIGVLLVHSISMLTWVLSPTLQGGVNGAAELGAFGVDLFFVLSGFLITGILLDAKESSRYFRNFYAKRFLRLFPVYYAYLLFTATVLRAIIQVGDSSLGYYTGNWWWYVLYVSNWKPGNGAQDAWLGQFWSLAVEEQFYIVWPAIVLLLSRRQLAWLCGLLIGLAFTMRCVLSSSDVYWNVIYRVTVTRFDTIALGAMVALAMRSADWRARFERWAVPVALGASTCFFAAALFARSFSWTEKPIQTLGSLAAAISMAAVIAYCVTRERGRLIHVLRSRFLTAYGKYSYGMYVYHPVVFTLCSIPELRLLRHTRPELGLLVAMPMFLVTHAALFWIARLSWNHFESPILRYKAKFTDSRPLRPIEGSATAEESHPLSSPAH